MLRTPNIYIRAAQRSVILSLEEFAVYACRLFCSYILHTLSNAMGSLDGTLALPNAQSPDLHLSHPTPGECLSIWKLTSLAWKDALSLPLYLQESDYLTTIPLAKDGGMTLWILVDKNLPSDQRTILYSCETFRKRSLLSNTEGYVTERIVHGVASVFCDPAYRRRGYSSRMMRELARVLHSWQVETTKCIGSVLYSDIGKDYYAKLGWRPIPNNSHIEFPSAVAAKPLKARKLVSEDLQQLCKIDEAMIQKAMKSISDKKVRMTLIPDHDHMLWHHKKEEFVCDKLFGKQPLYKGAIAGKPGNRVWVIWTHRFYKDPELTSSENTLYILRLVIENQATMDAFLSAGRVLSRDSRQLELQTKLLESVLQTAQAEAAEWNLAHVKLWDPSPLVREMVEISRLENYMVEREHEGIASLLWYGEGGTGNGDGIEWIGNEKFAWC